MTLSDALLKWGGLLRFMMIGTFHSYDDLFCRKRDQFKWEKRLAELRVGTYPHMEGRWAVVTGANSGIGYQLALLLAKCGISVILACRSEARGKHAQQSIRAELDESCGNVEYMNLDVSNLESVSSFAKSMQGRGVGLLVCNAGAMCLPWSLSKQGFETVFAGHVMGHMLLSKLMIPEMVRSNKGTARIIHVSSRTIYESRTLANFFARPVEPPKGWETCSHYGNVKCTQAACVMALADEIDSEDVAILAMHPGCVSTDITQNSGLPIAAWAYKIFAKLMHISAQEAAVYVLRMCLSDDCAPSCGSGRYFHCGHAANMGPAVSNKDDRKYIWNLCQEALREGNWL